MNVAGAVHTTDTAMTLGAVTLTDNASLQSGGGAIQVGSIAGGDFALDLDGGATGAIAVSGSVDHVGALTIDDSDGTTFAGSVGATGPGSVTILATASGQTVAFQGNTHLTSLDTSAGGAYAVSFTGSVTTVDAATTFDNSGGLTLGNAAGDSTTFTGGLNSGTNLVNVAGAVHTTDTAMTLGAVTLTDNASLQSGGGAIQVGSIAGGDFALDLDGGATGAIAVSGSVDHVAP